MAENNRSELGKPYERQTFQQNVNTEMESMRTL